MERKLLNRKEVYGSLLFTLIICSKLINSILAGTLPGGIQSGLLTMGAIWMLTLLYYIRYASLKVNKIGTILLLYILCFFGISNFVLTEHVEELTLHFVEYGVLGYIIAGADFDFEKTTRFTGYIILLLSASMIQLMQNSYNAYSSVLGMGESYTLLPPAFAVLTHFIYYRRKKDYLMYLSYAFSVYVLYNIFARGTRGAILCFIVFIFLAVMNSPRVRNSFNLYRGILFVLAFILILNADTILLWMSNFLAAHGLNIRFIEKTINLGSDVSNGRFYRYQLAWSDFLSSPIWGNGIGFFPEAHNINYPHNLFLQVLSEGGLLLGLPIIAVSVIAIYYLIFGKIQNRNYRIALLMLVSCTIPAAFVSDELWNYQLLWLAFGILIKKNKTLMTNMNSSKQMETECHEV